MLRKIGVGVLLINPAALGTLWGATHQGGINALKITPKGASTRLYSFCPLANYIHGGEPAQPAI
jgi:hypothetical protein